MGSTHPTPDTDPQQLKAAQDFWRSFTKAGTYGTVFIVILLILMAVFLL